MEARADRRSAATLRRELHLKGDPERAAFLATFFRTGNGEYGEGDRFLGLSVPTVRDVIRAYREMPLQGIATLLADPIHEIRLAALLILVWQFQHSDERTGKTIARFYLEHLAAVNNWDLVDSSAPQILGAHLWRVNDASLLARLARRPDLWTQRVAIVATHWFTRQGDVRPTFTIARLLVDHPHDLIHKAVGWMLREAGKKDRAALEQFLEDHAATMPRTMLRYAIERFDQTTRRRYLGQRRLTARPQEPARRSRHL